MQEIIAPTLEAMRERGTPFQGVLYAGLMITPEGPKLIEYNVRFGDPECQVLMLRLQSDLLPVLSAAAAGDLSRESLDWSGNTALTVVIAAKGYPGTYTTGSIIENLAEAERTEGVKVFHAGTALSQLGKVIGHGGRVLNVAATGRDAAEAQSRAYAAARKINWSEGFYRGDIGWRSVQREDNP
jgi:phosphoribosylamine---glycine ligase